MKLFTIYDEINFTLIEFKKCSQFKVIPIRNTFLHIILYHIKYKQNIKISENALYIEHNYLYDDIMFLIPLYSLIIKTKYVMFCNDTSNLIYSELVKSRKNDIKYSIYLNCICFDIVFLKLLHIHSNIFRFCKYNSIYHLAKNNQITITYKNICKINNYSLKYTIVTTLYRRYNIEKQLNTFNRQILLPNHIILVHDRNYVKLNISSLNTNIIYIHTMNFKAGYYFRYLMALLSPDDEIIIYDDDWFPIDQHSHLFWINKINKSRSIICHHIGKRGHLIWCATPLLCHRKWIYLMWIYKIYYEMAAEDGHLSFSLLLLCDIRCRKIPIHDLQYKVDNLSSSKHFISSILWKNYTDYIKTQINSSLIANLKNIYKIY